MNLEIYKYKNYREYLKDFYTSKKSNNKQYSYAVFSRRAGLNSPNYLKRVMDGTRNITHKNLRNFISGLGLQKKEANYFENLVMFNQSEGKSTKDYYFGELKKTSEKTESAFQLDAAFYDYLSHWYFVAIREMVNLKDFEEDASWISKQLKGKVTKSQAKKALELLIKLGFLSRGENGKLIQTFPKIKYLNEVKNLAVQKFHKQMMALAKESIDQEQTQSRDITGVTLCVRENDFQEMKEEIQAFRDQLNSKFSVTQGEGEKVVQVNFQLFSLTKNRKELPHEK